MSPTATRMTAIVARTRRRIPVKRNILFFVDFKIDIFNPLCVYKYLTFKSIHYYSVRVNEGLPFSFILPYNFVKCGQAFFRFCGIPCPRVAKIRKKERCMKKRFCGVLLSVTVIFGAVAVTVAAVFGAVCVPVSAAGTEAGDHEVGASNTGIVGCGAGGGL